MNKKDQKFLEWLPSYLRYVDYIGAASLYLKENFFLKEKLRAEHIKPRVLGHWGTVPGLNFIYANLNYLVSKHKCEMLMVTGPGHGAPSILANLFAEETITDFYKNYPRNAAGMGKLIHDFSWPHTPFPSHVTPTVPGSILEGGELGYSLSTAYGAAMDNPDLIVATVVGDGEAETGPIATAWHSNKFFSPKTGGAVLPIVHVNGYKISNPTIFGIMSDVELRALFTGYGYEPFIVEEPNIEKKMMEAMEQSYQIIRDIQKRTRKTKNLLKPKWPVIILRTLKGWKGVHDFGGHKIEGSSYSHGIPLEGPRKDPKQLEAIEKWLMSYRIEDLIDSKGRPKKEILEFVPKGKWRIGMNKHALGGNLIKKLKLPNSSKYEIKFKKPGEVCASSMLAGGQFLRDVFKKNKNNFRIMCPDEMESNKLHSVFEATKRAYVWPTAKHDENISPDGRVMEMLSEHTLQGWLQGYILTGRHGMFFTYEAFAGIISSMVDQYAKFLKQSLSIPWRKPLSSPVYVMTSVGWRQDHNGYSHQNPSFVSNVLQKHGEFCQIYYPADANSLLVAFEETLQRKNAICVIVSDKREVPQWLTLKQAREQAKVGIGIWDFITNKAAVKNPDVVLASCGDHVTQEAIFAVRLCKQLVPELKIRYVNVSELTSLCLGDICKNKDVCLTETGINHYFTADKPVVFNYHGYVNDVEQILWPYASSKRFSIHGYHERGSTTTPFDLKVLNQVSCFDIAIDLITQAAKKNKSIARKANRLIESLRGKIAEHQAYIKEYGDDMPEVVKMKW